MDLAIICFHFVYFELVHTLAMCYEVPYVYISVTLLQGNT